MASAKSKTSFKSTIGGDGTANQADPGDLHRGRWIVREQGKLHFRYFFA
jgi:hypothetical protein